MNASLTAQLQALLFVASRPLSFKKVGELLHASVEDVRKALGTLRELFQSDECALQVLEQSETIQLVTKPQFAPLLSSLVRDEVGGELTRPALETLTIIAYRGPIRKGDIDHIRGVNCSLILRNLLLRGLVDVDESQPLFERAYSISMDFLRHLGIERVEDLPEYGTLHADATVAAILEESSPTV